MKYKEIHYLEINGNIMPQQLTQLCESLGQTQNGEYSVAKIFTKSSSLDKNHFYSYIVSIISTVGKPKVKSVMLF